MFAVLGGFAELLAASPDPVLVQCRVGAWRPSTPGDIAAVIVSLSIEDNHTTGLGFIAHAATCAERP
jgi:hypothetical protein